MPIFKKEGTIGYRVGESVYHPECYEAIENKIRVTDVVKEEETEEHIFICDRCNKEIE
jgi:hypothetical protein